MNFQLSNVVASLPDDRDYRYIRQKTVLPAVDLRPFVYEIEDQSTIGSCVTNGTCAAIELMCNRAKEPADYSRMFLYYTMRDYENRIGQEGGAVADALKMGRRYGIPLETTWPYDLSKENIKPSDAAYAEALGKPIVRYEKVIGPEDVVTDRTEKILRIKSALCEGLPVVFAMQVSNSIFGLIGDWRSQNYQHVFYPNNPSVGGHCMQIVGYDDTVGKFIVQNSWGATWGDAGYGGFGYSIVDEPYFEAWVIRTFADVEVREPPGIKLEKQTAVGIECRVVCDPLELGRTVNVWCGAKVPGIGLRLKRNLVDDEWYGYDGVNIPPTGQIQLADCNFITVVRYMDFTPLKGAEIIVAYGNTPMDWKFATITVL